MATEEDEEAWIARAREMPTRRLEQEVRRSARDDEPQDAEDPALEKRITVRCTPAVREKWGLAREMAERVAGQRLRAGEALELVAAEVFSAISIDPAFAEVPDEMAARPPRRCGQDHRKGRTAAGARARSPGLPGSIASLAAGLDEADAFELDRRLRLAVRLEQTLDAAIAPLLRVVTSPEYEWRGDYCPLSTYAPEQLGMSASKARALLRLERAADVCPELRDAYRSGRLSWVKAHGLLPLLLLDIEGEWRPVWVAWAERVTVRRLEQDVERALLLRAGHSRAFARCLFDPERAQDPIPSEERQMCAHDVDVEATQRLAWRVPCEVAALFCAVRETVRSRLRGRARPVPRRRRGLRRHARVRAAGLDAAGPPRAPSRPVVERDGYRCAVPGCTSRRNLHDHHLRFRSAGGSDAPGNRVALCAFHHQRCLHVGFMRIRGRAPDGLVFELGLRRRAPPLVRYRSGDIEAPRTQASPARVPRGERPEFPLKRATCRA